MMCLRSFGLGMFLILFPVAAHAAGAEVERDRRLRTTHRTAVSPHDQRYHRSGATSITFSPDGNRLAASYYVPAFNRPGTDWGAWTAQWDLKTGKRLVIPNAYYPVAFSPDGQTIAMGFYKRSRKPGRRMSPQVRLALWKPGADKPFRLLKQPDDNDGSVIVSTTFNLNGKRVLAMTSAGQLLSWHRDKDDPSKVLDQVEVGGRDGGRGLTAPVPTMAISREGGLLAAFPPTQYRNGRAVLWRYLLDGSGRDTYALKRKKTYEAGLVTWDAGAVKLMGQSPCRPGWAYLFAVEKFETGRWRLRRFYTNVAFCRPTRMLAFSARGKVSLNRYNGELVRRFPAAGGAVAFSPDGKRLAAGDNRGIIRIWDVAGGRLVRARRLDDRPGNTVLVAAVQCYSEFGDPASNRKKLAGMVRRAASRGAKIVVLPEAAITGYLSADLKNAWRVGNRPISDGLVGVDPVNAAETVPGPSTKMFGKLADQFGIYLTVPLLEVDRKTGRYYNTSALLGPDGRMLIHYRKRGPWRWAERGWASRGDRGNAVVDTPFGRLGLLICYDIHDQAQVMGRLKINTLLYSVAWVEDKGSDWFAKKLPAVARANGFNIVAANWTVPKGAAPNWYGYGQSRIIDATGKVLAKVKDDLQEEIVYTELPLPGGA